MTVFCKISYAQKVNLNDSLPMTELVRSLVACFFCSLLASSTDISNCSSTGREEGEWEEEEEEEEGEWEEEE